MEEVACRRASTSRTSVILLALLLVVLPLMTAGCASISPNRAQQDELTRLFGEEAKATVQKYESVWLSAAVALNPALKYELATTQWADYMGIPASQEGASGLLTTSASVKDVKVIEYSPTRLKTWACTTNTFDEITRQGTVLRSGTISRCGTYVFWKMDNTWKLAGYFNDADRRYWRYAPEWLKGIIGDLPNE